MSIKSPYARHAFRRARSRARLVGTPARPRLSVGRTSKHIYAQLIDDLQGKTLVSACTLEEVVRSAKKSGATIFAAQAVGKLLAEKARAKGIEAVVFDRGGRPYHGRIKALAEGAREAGLKF